MKVLKTISALILTITVLSSFFYKSTGGDKPVPVPPSPQRVGDAQKGKDYLVTGDYVRSGLPLGLFLMAGEKGSTGYLPRTGANEKLPYQYTAVTAPNGKVLVAPNCLQCHARVFEGELYIGLGNTAIDFTDTRKLNPKKLRSLSRFLKTTAPKNWEAAAPFLTVTEAISPYLKAEAPGVNMADRLAAVLAAHRDPQTFAWLDTPQLDIPAEAIPTDTPPWWLLKKKNAMFYNGFGRGDFGRFLMASNLLTVNDTTESAEVDRHMPDLLAYLYTIEPPKYPKAIDSGKAAAGKTVFQRACASCHGTYGESETYPNLLIPQSIIKTDSALYQSNYSNPQFVAWFNKSWFTTGDHPAQLQPFTGYMAPPLDGIWITAPYLHNGSVPTLEALLNSALRPRMWSRDFNKEVYDYEKVGWEYTAHETDGSGIYNTGKKGYGAYGHYFGDKLTGAERDAVLEYLKTL
jgi:mono/diheme cytochrome c family protein